MSLPDELQELCNELGITLWDNPDMVCDAARALWHDGVLSHVEYRAVQVAVELRGAVDY